MTKRDKITSLSIDEAKAKIARGESRSDFTAANALSDEIIRRQAANDPEDRD